MYLNPDCLSKIDILLRTTTEGITNVHFDDRSWTQAALPVRFGGLGLRSISNLALPCFISSLNKSQPLITEILPSAIPPPKFLLDMAINTLSTKHPNIVYPSEDNATQQRAWDDAVSVTEFNKLKNSAHQIDSARLLASSSPNSGSWLHALPIPKLGLHLDNEIVRIAIS